MCIHLALTFYFKAKSASFSRPDVFHLINIYYTINIKIHIGIIVLYTHTLFRYVSFSIPFFSFDILSFLQISPQVAPQYLVLHFVCPSVSLHDA